MIAGCLEGNLQQIEVDGRHLWAQDGIVFAHLLGKRNLGDGGRLYLALIVSLFSYPDSGEKRADTDSGRAQIIYLVDFQRCIDLIRFIQDGSHLVGCYGIQAASEGIQLDQIQIIGRLHIVRGSVQAGMVHPLVHDVERPLHRIQVGDGIFCKHCDVIRVDQFRNPVVYLRVNMIRASGQDDAPVAGLIQILNGFLALAAHILAAGCQFFPCRMHGRLDLSFENRELGG